MIYPPSGLPPEISLAADCLKKTHVDIVTLIPTHIEDLGRNQELLGFLSQKVETVTWGGGDVSVAAGDAISQKLKLFTCVGSTEMGLWPTLRRSGPWILDQWKFVRFHPAMNMTLQPRSNGLFEGCIRRNSEPEYEQPIFKLFPNLEEYASGDLFSPHPSDPQLWQHRGRADDMQVFAAGEKFHPTDVEKLIAQHPDVQAVLFVGTRRTQGALLLEMNASTPIETSEQQAEVMEKVWPAIEEANKLCPGYAKVTKHHVLLVDPKTKPMARSGKGSVQRPATVELFEEQLSEMFERAKAESAPEPQTAHSLLTGSTAI